VQLLVLKVSKFFQYVLWFYVLRKYEPIFLVALTHHHPP